MGESPYTAEMQRKLAELNQLLDFAEEVSAKIDAANEEISRQSVYFGGIVSVVGVIAALAVSLQDVVNRSENRYIFMVMTIAVGAVIALFIANVFLRSSQRRKSLNVERRILGDLADMISSLFRSVQSRISSVDRALLTMRMRRLSLSHIHGEEVTHPY